MGESIEFIKTRAVATLAAINELAPGWVWQEKTAAEFEAQHLALEAAEEDLGEDETDMLDARATWDGKLDDLHRRTMQGLSMGKNRFRNQPLKLALVENLEARGDSRTAILKEALDWEKAWKATDVAWSPMPANTFVLFGALRLECLEPLQHAYKEKLTTWRNAANALSKLGREMEDVNEAWYADACKAFPEGTPEGDMIRSQIPTTYNPPPSASPTPPVTPP